MVECFVDLIMTWRGNKLSQSPFFFYQIHFKPLSNHLRVLSSCASNCRVHCKRPFLYWKCAAGLPSMDLVFTKLCVTLQTSFFSSFFTVWPKGTSTEDNSALHDSRTTNKLTRISTEKGSHFGHFLQQYKNRITGLWDFSKRWSFNWFVITSTMSFNLFRNCTSFGFILKLSILWYTDNNYFCSFLIPTANELPFRLIWFYILKKLVSSRRI